MILSRFKRSESVKHRPVIDRKKKKKLSKEPEMIELQRMIDTGELDQERTREHLKHKKEVE